MPLSRRLLPKVKAQSLPTNEPRPFTAPDPNRAYRSTRANNRTLTVYMLADRSQSLEDIDTSIEYATQQTAQLDAYRAFRRDLSRCNSNNCDCYCYCHSGNICAIDNGTERFHTHNHGRKPNYTLHTDSITGRREWRESVCHDITTISQYHLRSR